VVAAEALQWNDYVTLGIALLGFGLGIYNALQARRRDRRQVWVRGRYTEMGDDEVGYQEWIEVRAVGDGPRPVSIKEIGWVLASGRKRQYLNAPQTKPPLPATLSDGQSVIGGDLVEDLSLRVDGEKARLRGVYAIDEQGSTYRGEMEIAGRLRRAYNRARRRWRAWRRKRRKVAGHQGR
jgi:hypothetical protein